MATTKLINHPANLPEADVHRLVEAKSAAIAIIQIGRVLNDYVTEASLGEPSIDHRAADGMTLALPILARHINYNAMLVLSAAGYDEEGNPEGQA